MPVKQVVPAEHSSPGARERSLLARMIFPEDLSGKTVFAIGADFESFCLEALRRGADRVVGVDFDPARVEEARQQLLGFGARAVVERLDVESDSLGESFDYVLCLNILHNLRDPIGALHKLSWMARDRLVLETAEPRQDVRRNWAASRICQFVLNREPVILATALGPLSDRRFSISPSAIKHLLMHHQGLFARLEVHPSPRKRRFVSIAHKRRIGRLVVVAGPTAAGKSTLIDLLKRDEAPGVARRLGIADWAEWPVVEGDEIRDLTRTRIDKLIYHRNILKPYLRHIQFHQRDEALDLLNTAEQVVILTVLCPAKILHRQLETRTILPKSKDGKYQGKERHLHILDDYKNPGKVRAHYESWFDYTSSRFPRHFVVSLIDGVRIASATEWEALFETVTGKV